MRGPRERPILFSGGMVKAILAGHKTQTRRVMKPQPSEGWEPHSYGEVHKMLDGEFIFRNEEPVVAGWGPSDEEGYEAYPCPFGQPGDRLWVRESYRVMYPHGKAELQYKADFKPLKYDEWKASIFMPRWASRLTLEVTGVRVERLQDISKADVIAEGLTERDGYALADVHAGWHEPFAQLWDSINGDKPGRAWADNPWCWAIEFKQVTP